MEGPGFFAADELFVSADGEPTAGLHFAFQARDQETVRRFHEAALAAGGTDNGGPGERQLPPGLLLGLRRSTPTATTSRPSTTARRGAPPTRSWWSRPERGGRAARRLRPGLGPAVGLPADRRRDRRRAARGRPLRERRAASSARTRTRRRRRRSRASRGRSSSTSAARRARSAPGRPSSSRRGCRTASAGAPGSSQLLVTVRPALAPRRLLPRLPGALARRAHQPAVVGPPARAPADRARDGPLLAGDRRARHPARAPAQDVGRARRARPEAGPQGLLPRVRRPLAPRA